MSVTIRNFGNNTIANNNAELLESLKAYSGDSVTIQFQRPSGMKDSLHVDVEMNGDELSIKNSYTGKPLSDFNQLFQA